MKENVIENKSYSFALKIISLYKDLTNSQKEFVLSKQLVRAGTSIGSNVTEAIQGYSRKDFAAKISISLKETAETQYWLRLLKDSNYISNENFVEMHSDATELAKILTAILKTTKNSI